MLGRVTDVLATLETYYDTAPRAGSTPHEVGPFTLFVKDHEEGWDYYARPRLGLDGEVTAADVDGVRARQRELGVPEAMEWVHETTPSLLMAARASGLAVEECPLLVLAELVELDASAFSVRLLGHDDDLGAVAGAVHAAFSETDEVVSRPVGRRAALTRDGLLVTVGAYDASGAVVGGGSHGPRGDTTEIVGIGVLPRARRRGVGVAVAAALASHARAGGVRTVFLSAQDHTVARVYARAGFEQVGTACIAEPAERP